MSSLFINSIAPSNTFKPRQGVEFDKQNKDQFQPMYDKMNTLPNVNNIGYKPNIEVIEAMQSTHIFAYPSIWEETFVFRQSKQWLLVTWLSLQTLEHYMRHAQNMRIM